MISCRNFASTINNYYKSKENEKAIYFVVGTEKVIPVFSFPVKQPVIMMKKH